MTNDFGSDDFLGGSEDAGFFGDSAGPDLFGDTPVSSEPSENQSASSLTGASEKGLEPISNPGPVAKPQADGYVVLARKYRPQTFDDIVGQQGVQQGLRGAIATGQISHAYLFSGPRGTGKTSTARILAKALNCQEGGPRPDPCGKCSSCRAITAGSSLDVIEIDAASNTGVDNIRELKSGVVLAPFSRYKVYIVDEVHMLSNQAFNALLKTLEEPPPQVIFVLATTELHKVPETIISRCTTFMFRRFSLAELKGQLGSILDIEVAQRGLEVSADDREKILDLVSRNAEGGMRDAQVTLDQVLVLSKGKLDFESVRRFLGMADVESLGLFVRHLADRQARELLELIDVLVSQGQDLELFVKGVCEYLRDLLLVQCAGRDTSLINVSEDRALELEAAAKSLSPAFMINTIDHLLKVVGEMKVSGQPRTILELSILKLTIVEAVDMGSILQRLDALEAGGDRPSSGQVVSERHSNPAASPAARSSRQIEAIPIPSNHDTRSGESATKMESSVSEPPLAVSYSAANIEAAMEQVYSVLRAENSMLALSFDKARLGFSFKENVVTFMIDPSQSLAARQIERPQSMATLTGIVQRILGRPVAVKTELSETSAKLDNPLPGPVKYPAPQLSETPVTDYSTSVMASESSISDNVTESDLTIYYPDEIREKTMLEVSSVEFESLMNTDSGLKELVEKAKEAFGIDKSKIKFHRSTLA